MAVSKTIIGKRLPRKQDPYIVETVLAAKKKEKWQTIAQIVSGSRRRYSAVNLKRIDAEAAEGDTIVIPGKVLGSGELSKRLRVCALYFSSSAINKIKHSHGEAIRLVDEIKKNPQAQGVTLLK